MKSLAFLSLSLFVLPLLAQEAPARLPKGARAPEKGAAKRDLAVMEELMGGEALWRANLQRTLEARFLNDSVAAFDPMEFDLDGDGLLSAKEQEAARAEVARRVAREMAAKNAAALAAYDANRDGKIDAAEAKAMQPEIAKAQAQRQEWGLRRQAMLAKYDRDHDGQLSPAERQAMLQQEIEAELFANTKALKKYDRNFNGKLDDDEKDLLRNAWLRIGDRNGNGKLELEELTLLWMEQNRLNNAKAGINRETREQQRLRQFDLDGDGKLNEEEARRADEAERQLKELQVKAPPLEE